MAMLRNTGKCLMVLLLGLCWAMVLSPRAVAGEKPAVKTKVKAQAKDDISLTVHVWKRIRSFQSLERAILAGVKLDAGQRSSVTKAFEGLYRGMRNDPQKASFYPRAYPVYDAEKLKKRKVALKEAKKAGDEKLRKKIKADIDKHTIGSEANLSPIAEDIATDLASVMRGNQIADYKRVVDRWRALKARGPFDGPIRMMIRAVQDPELKMDAEQRLAVEYVLADTQLALRKNRDPENVVKLATSAREKIIKILKSEQRTHLDKTLHMLAGEMKAIRNYANKWFGSRGRATPAHFKQPVPW